MSKSSTLPPDEVIDVDSVEQLRVPSVLLLAAMMSSPRVTGPGPPMATCPTPFWALKTIALWEIRVSSLAWIAGPSERLPARVLSAILSGSLAWIALPAVLLVLLNPMKLDSTLTLPLA